MRAFIEKAQVGYGFEGPALKKHLTMNWQQCSGCADLGVLMIALKYVVVELTVSRFCYLSIN